VSDYFAEAFALVRELSDYYARLRVQVAFEPLVYSPSDTASAASFMLAFYALANHAALKLCKLCQHSEHEFTLWCRGVYVGA
jgi:hypothetical protein